MITNVYFVRHAEPDFSVKDDLLRPLTEKGAADSRKATSTLLHRDISMVYSSPYKRAIDTVKDFADKRGLRIFTMDGFCERRVGEWVEDFRAYSRKQWEDFDFRLEQGESLREVQKRNISALYEVMSQNDGKNIVVGSHGTALSTIINHFNSKFGYDDFWGIVDKMPFILCFRFDDGKLECMEEIEVG